MAAKGDISVANVSYNIAGKIGPFSGFKVHNDYSILRKRVGTCKDAQQNVTGLSFLVGVSQLKTRNRWSIDRLVARLGRRLAVQIPEAP